MHLWKVKEDHNIWIVANRWDERLPAWDLNFTTRDNTGLEWGAYNHFLMKLWEGGNTLYCHDDLLLLPIMSSDDELLESSHVFSKFNGMEMDQAYIFQSRRDDVVNWGKHGRMVYMSDDFQQVIKDQGGFWFDERNNGYISGENKHLREKMKCFGYNAAINNFHDQAKRTGLDVHKKVYMPSILMAHRGQLQP